MAARQRRIQQEYKKLQRSPVPLCAAAPREDDLSTWDGVIGVKLGRDLAPMLCAALEGMYRELGRADMVPQVKELVEKYRGREPELGKMIREKYGRDPVAEVNLLADTIPEEIVPLHILIVLPEEYPLKAPNVGFSFHFKYTMGASSIERSGPLAGKQVICLSLLGNFAQYHKDWDNDGMWSAATTMSTLLVQLQSVLATVEWSKLNPEQLQQLRQQAELPEAKRLLPLPTLESHASTGRELLKCALR